MENGEGSNQIPDLNIAIDAIIPTSYVKTEDASNVADDVDGADDDGADVDVADDVDGADVDGADDDGAVPSNDLVRRRPAGRPKGSTKKLKANELLRFSFPYTRENICQSDQENGNYETVSSVLMRFDAVRRRLILRELGSEVSVALGTFKRLQLHTNQQKRMGPVPGINIGDIFYLYGEMALVGLHSATVAVEFLGSKESGDKDDYPVAISVVSSGENVDRSEDPNSIVFTGFGGTEKYGLGDQKLEKLNVPLEKALKKRNGVRVIRAMKDKGRVNGHIYVYDGIYTVKSIWEEIGRTGYNVFKFRLDREPDQKPGFATWKSVEQWKYGLFARPGTVLEDISNGAEKVKVPVVNEVDGENTPPEVFTYITSLDYPVMMTSILRVVDCCKCRSKSRLISCCSRKGSCECVDRNMEGVPYADGVLITRRQTVYECGESCLCFAECKNKMIHSGLKLKLEVFKTMECGWGLRSWDPIRAGTFICEYVGEIMEKDYDEDGDDYVFDTTRVYESFRWNYEPELVGLDTSERVQEENIVKQALVISAKTSGNVARFMNHSCSPNVFWQVIAREHYGLWSIHVGFFAMKHIPPLTELRYDYGRSRAYGQLKICFCGSQKCKGSFG